LGADWNEGAAPLRGAPVTDTVRPPPAPPPPGKAATAYVFTDDNLGAARLAVALLREGFHLAVATQALRADGRNWPRGTFIARLQRNPATLAERLAVLAPPLGVPVTAVQSALADSGNVGTGSDLVVSLHAPRIVVGVGGGISETSYGWLWHFLAR